MKKITCTAIFIVIAVFTIFSSCHRTQESALKIGLISGVGGFNDRGFNQDILDGYKLFKDDYGFYGGTRECLSEADFASNINYFLADGFDLIITVGYAASSATIEAARANPGTDFIILDYSMDNPSANLLCVIFQVDESSFPCGFLAAYWAQRQNPTRPLAGFVAGPDIPQIRQFSESYSHGIAYYNQQYQKNVGVEGYFASSFSDTLQGAQLADSLIRQNASVIFAFAGKTGNGALYKVKEAGKWAIGVDVDQYYSIPEVGSVLLTSCVKHLKTTVYSLLQGYNNGTYYGGQVVKCDLKRAGVGMAPFHEYETAIPDSIKVALDSIMDGIQKGKISTGWN